MTGSSEASPRAYLEKPPRRVFIRDLELMARVGVYEIEKRYVQRIVVSIDLRVVDDYDGISDRLDGVLDYGQVVSTIRDIVESDHFHLIETLAERIAAAVLEDARILLIKVAIEKPDIMPGCRSVGVEIERRRAV